MKKQRGQTLIEVLAAFSVAAVLVTAIVVAIISALSNTIFSKNQNIGTRYAQEGVEIIRQIRNNSLSEFTALNVNYCLNSTNELEGKITIDCPQDSNGISREVKIERGDDATSCGTNNPTKVTVTVLWADNKCSGAELCHNTKLVSCLSETTSAEAPTPGQNATPVPLSVPVGFSVINIGDSLRISWDRVTGATGYKLYYCGSTVCNPSTGSIVFNGNAMNYVHNIGCGGYGNYAVRASNDIEDSALSSVVGSWTSRCSE